MPGKKIDKTPISYSFFYNTTSTNAKKQEPNECLRSFLEYIKKTTKILSKEQSNAINFQVASKLDDQKLKRHIIQAINLQLTIEAVQDLYPDLLKSKQISRQWLEEILNYSASK